MECSGSIYFNVLIFAYQLKGCFECPECSSISSSVSVVDFDHNIINDKPFTLFITELSLSFNIVNSQGL